MIWLGMLIGAILGAVTGICVMILFLSMNDNNERK